MRGKTVMAALAGGILVAASARDSRACGGCFIRQTSQVGTVVTDHRMIFAVSPTQTTLYDQIQYSGSPSDFAWVLPIHGTVGLGVSSDLLFSVLSQRTQTTILAPPYPCPQCNCLRGPMAGGGGSSSGGFASAGADGGVTVTAQQVVGPYDTVQLHPNSTTDTAALLSWLQTNSYAVPPAIDPVIAAYVQEGFDFLAIKLVPGQGVRAMRPISVTSTGASLSLPLRMVAAGTGATVGITLWVVATGRYEPSNFPSFTIAPSSLVWDWSTSSSNYATLRTQKEQLLGNSAWQIESSLDLSPYSIESAVLQDPAASAYAAVPPQDGGTGQTAIEVRSQDLNTLFPSGGTATRITRMRADLSQAALATDLVLAASADQSPVSNTYQVALSTNANCPASCPCGNTSSSSGGSGLGSSSSGSGTFGPDASVSSSGVSSSDSGAVGSDSGVGSSGSGGSSSGGVSSSGSDSDSGLGTGGNGPPGPAVDGGNGNPPSPRSQSSGCSTSASQTKDSSLFAALTGLVGLALFRARARKTRPNGA